MEFETKYVSGDYLIARDGTGSTRYSASFKGEPLGLFSKLPAAKEACEKHAQLELPSV